MSSPKISVCVPAHYAMQNYDFFMERLIRSLDRQTFRDFELVITHDGKMAENSNSAIKKAKGEIIKVLYLDDYLYSTEALQNLADNFTGGWLATGCVHDNGEQTFSPHYPTYNTEIQYGNNTVGSPSVVAFENKEPLLFDESLSWLLDCDLYYRLYERYGEPKLLPYLDVGIGVGRHQTTHLMSDKDKVSEFNYLREKHGTTNQIAEADL